MDALLFWWCLLLIGFVSCKPISVIQGELKRTPNVLERDDRVNPPPSLLNPNGFYEMFTFIDTPESVWSTNERNMVIYALFEGIAILFWTSDRAVNIDTISSESSFERYFRREDFNDVKNVFRAAMQQLGATQPGWTRQCAFDSTQYPLKIFLHVGPPGLPDRDQCQTSQDDGENSPLIACMSDKTYTGKPTTEKQIMVVCKHFLYGLQSPETGYLRYRTTKDIDRNHLLNFASQFGNQAESQGKGGMYFAGLDLLHEVLHWKVFDSTVPERMHYNGIDDVLFVNSEGEDDTAYGPWASQDLKREDPEYAVANADSYIWYLVEEFWRKTYLTGGQHFVETPNEYSADYSERAAVQRKKRVYHDEN